MLRAAAATEKSEDREAALAAYLGTIGLDSATDEGALGVVKRLAEAPEFTQKLTEITSQVASSLEEPQRTTYWRRLALFFEREMNQPDQAIAAWRHILETHANDAEATAELDRLYESVGSPEELVAHLRQKLEQAEDDATRAALSGQVAELLASRLNDIPGAIRELQRTCELAPGQRLPRCHRPRGNRAVARSLHVRIDIAIGIVIQNAASGTHDDDTEHEDQENLGIGTTLASQPQRPQCRP